MITINSISILLETRSLLFSERLVRKVFQIPFFSSYLRMEFIHVYLITTSLRFLNTAFGIFRFVQAKEGIGRMRMKTVSECYRKRWVRRGDREGTTDELPIFDELPSPLRTMRRHRRVYGSSHRPFVTHEVQTPREETSKLVGPYLL